MALDLDAVVDAAYASPAPKPKASFDPAAVVDSVYHGASAKPTPPPPKPAKLDPAAVVDSVFAKEPQRKQPPKATPPPTATRPAAVAPPTAMPGPGRISENASVKPPIATDSHVTPQERERTVAAGRNLTTALGTAGDYITLGTLGGGPVGATVRDRAEELRRISEAKTPRERLERIVEAGANQVPGVARAGPHGQAVAHTLAAGHLNPAAVRAVNDEYATFGHPNSEAIGLGPAVRAAAGVVKQAAPIASAALSGANAPAAAGAARLAGRLDPKVAESMVEGGAQFGATLVGPGNAVPGLAAKGVGALGRRGSELLKAHAPETHQAIADALATAPITGTPYHALYKEVPKHAHPQARAAAREYMQAPQHANAPAMVGVKRAFEGLAPGRGDEAAHRVIDAYQAGAHRRLVEKADEADRANAAAITALHQEELAAGTASDRRIRVNLRDAKGNDNARFVDAVPDKEARDRALTVADSMEHAARMPANLTADELRRAKALEVDTAELERQLIPKKLLDPGDTVPGYFPMSHAWAWPDEVPGAGGQSAARRLAVNTSYTNPATFRTLAEARELGPTHPSFLQAPYSQTSVRQGYLLDRQRKLENLFRQRAFKKLGALPTNAGGTLRELPDYLDAMTGATIPGSNGPVPYTNARGVTKMLPPNELAAKRLAQYQAEKARGTVLKDLNIQPDELPKRRPPVVSAGQVRSVERAADSATALSGRADMDANQAIIRANLRRARDDRAAAAGAAGVADTVRKGAAGVEQAVGSAGMGVVDAAERGRALSGRLAERVRRATQARLSLTFRPQVPGASRRQSDAVRDVLSEWVQHRLENPAYQPIGGGEVTDAVGNVLERKVLGGAGHDTGQPFTGTDIEEARKQVERVLGKPLPGRVAEREQQIREWLQDGYDKGQQIRAKLPPEYGSVVPPRVQGQVDAAAGAVQRAGNTTAEGTIGAVQRGAGRVAGASARGANRTLREIDRNAMKGDKLREAALGATVGDLGRLVDRVALRASKFTDEAKRVSLARDLSNAKRATLDDYEARLAARRNDPVITGRDLIIHKPGYTKLTDSGLGLKDEHDAQIIGALHNFLTAKRVPGDVATPVSETLGTLNRFARTSLVFNPVIHTVNNQGSIYMALTGDARGVADATRAVFTSDGRAFEDFVRSKTFSRDPSDTMRYWDQLSQENAAWHPTSYRSRAMGTQGSVERDAQGAITGYKRPTGEDDFAVLATSPVRSLGEGRNAASALRIRAKKIGYEMQRWNSEAVFNRGERVYAAYLMRHFVRNEGLSPAEAANRVREAMGTDLLTEGERSLSGRVFFYPWMKTVIGLSLRLGIAKPQTWNAPLQGTATQRDAVGASEVGFSKTNPYALAFPDAKGGFNSYSLPIYNRILEPIARTVNPPEPDATWEDRAGPLGNYLLGHLNPLEQNAFRFGVMGLNSHALPPYMQPFDPDAAPKEQLLQGLRSAAGSVAYPLRAGEQAATDPVTLLPTLLGGTLGHRSERTQAEGSQAAHKRLVLDLERRMHAARRRGNEAEATRLERDLEYQRSR